MFKNKDFKMINKGKAIRYFLIMIIYNFIISSMAYIVQWINNTYLQYTMANWDFVDFWLFISIMILFGGFMLYLAPFFEKWLYYKLELKIKKTEKKFKNGEIRDMGRDFRE